jgi:chromosome segregation ATPase
VKKNVNVSYLEQRIKDLEATIATKNNLLNQGDAEFAHAKQTISNLQIALEDMQSAYLSVQRKEEDAKIRLGQAKIEIDRLKQDIEDWKGCEHMMQDQIKDLDSSIARERALVNFLIDYKEV